MGKTRNASDSNRSAFSIITTAAPEPTEVFETYWRFAAERQAIFFRRLRHPKPPWTQDPTLREYKFTNAYRASDRVSQFLIRSVIYEGEQTPEEVFFRIILFKLFNKIETWNLLTQELGTIAYKHYSFNHYDRVLSEALNSGTRIYSAAYIMPSGGSAYGTKRKHQAHLYLLEQMMRDELHLRITDATCMREVISLLLSYPMIGNFLAYQYATDINYSVLTDFSEMDFVIPGPGALDGIRKCFSSLGKFTAADIIAMTADRQETHFERMALNFQTLWGRRLQLIDCQNLFCEVSKYARVNHPQFIGALHRVRIKQRYQMNPDALRYWYPPKWGINDKVVATDNLPSVPRQQDSC